MSNDKVNPRRVRNPKLARVQFPTRSPSPRSSIFPPTKPIMDENPPAIPGTYPTTPSSTIYPWNPQNPYVPPQLPRPAPEIFTTLPPLRDHLETKTSKDQSKTVSKVLPLLSSRENPLPRLKRALHIEFLEQGIDGGKLPSFMVALDASRPWIVYWCLTGLATLGVDVSVYRERVIETLTPLQNPTGGFGGGHGQYSHLAGSYAAVLSLTIVGNDPVTGEHALSLVDRRTMLRWLHSLKLPSGSFAVAVGGETDVRGAYCALTIISLLGLPTSDGLVDGTAEFLASCQTYEGGFAALPGNEAHGGYAFCALAALSILVEPATWAELIDLDGAIRWLSARQYAPEGGLSGRTNKLVDGCYSTWIGGCWALVEAAVKRRAELAGATDVELAPLWSREGLVRYILTAAQSPNGGMRDKPGMYPDFYHTAYVLLGLSSCQHSFSYYLDPAKGPSEFTFDAPLPLKAAYGWEHHIKIPGIVEIVEGVSEWPDDVKGGDEDELDENLGLDGDRLRAHHPIFNVPFAKAIEAKEWAEGLVGF